MPVENSSVTYLSLFEKQSVKWNQKSISLFDLKAGIYESKKIPVPRRTNQTYCKNKFYYAQNKEEKRYEKLPSHDSEIKIYS